MSSPGPQLLTHQQVVEPFSRRRLPIFLKMRRYISSILVAALFAASTTAAFSVSPTDNRLPEASSCKDGGTKDCVAAFDSSTTQFKNDRILLGKARAEGRLRTLSVIKDDKSGKIILMGDLDDVQMAYKILAAQMPKATAPKAPPCADGGTTYCVDSYYVGTAWVASAKKLLERYKYQATPPLASITILPDYKTGSLLVLGNQTDIMRTHAMLDNIAKSAKSFGDPASKPDKQLQLCTINDISPDASLSVFNAVTTFLSGGNSIPNPPPTIAPSPTASVTPAPAPTPAFSGKYGSVILDSQQRRIILHVDPDSVTPLREVLSAFTNVSPIVYHYYDVRYSVPDPIPEPSTASIGSGLLSSAASTTAPLSSVNTLASTVAAVMNGMQSGVALQPDTTYPRILVAGPANGVNEALRLLDDLDKKPAQIHLTLNVLEYDTIRARNLGVQIPPTAIISGSVGAYIAPTSAGAATPAPILHGKIVGLTAPTVPLDFNTLMNDGILKLQSSPQVETLNGRQAVVDVGQIIPFTANTINAQGALVSNIVNYTIGTHLEVTPFINYDGSISVYVHPINSTLTGFTVQNAPQINRRELSANFRLHPGEAIFLTGLTADETSDVRDQIPGLALIPWLGKHLFGNRNSTDNYTKLSIELTAEIEDPGELAFSAPHSQVTTAPLSTPSPVPPMPLSLHCKALTTATQPGNGANPPSDGSDKGAVGKISAPGSPSTRPDNGSPVHDNPIPVDVPTRLPIAAPPTPFATPAVGPGSH